MLPAWLAWLLPVPVATLGAIAWVSFRTRTRGPQEPADSMQAYERFRAAMAAPLPPSSRPAGTDGPEAERR